MWLILWSLASLTNPGEAANFLKDFGVKRTKHKMSTKTKVLSFADAGILNNISTDVMLRPQRTTDVMIVMDFSYNPSDDHFLYNTLLSAAAQAWQSGLDFPDVDFEKITNMPPKELLVFPSNGPNCPTVLWFTLCNRNFKNLKDYQPMSTAKTPGKSSRKFNDFKVFGKDAPYSTFAFHYDKYHFDQLKELVYYNVTTHVEEIKSALAGAVQKKREQCN